MIEFLSNWLINQGVAEGSAVAYSRWIAAALTILFCYLAYLAAKRFLFPAVAYSVSRTVSSLDDVMAENRVTNYLALLAPALILYFMMPVVLFGYDDEITLLQKTILIFMILIGVLAIRALLNGLLDRYHRMDVTREIPLTNFFQVISVIVFFIAFLLILGIILDRNPLYLLSGFGAIMAILTIVFRDPLLGLMAGIQLTANRLVARGDVIDLPKYDASGEVLAVALTTVTIRNADQSITTVPTYSLISESFKNWRGIKESGVRQIRRTILIDVHSIAFCTPEMISRFAEEISDLEMADSPAVSDHEDAQNQTNLGIFRGYVVAYLRTLTQIDQDKQLMVRQLQQTSRGLPLEIFAYSMETYIVDFELLQSAIFEHILAKAPDFDLQIYQDQ